MNNVVIRNQLVILSLTVSMLLAACSQEPDAPQQGASTTDAAVVEAQSPQQTGDVIARVGDQVITFSELNLMLNSAAVVGLSSPHWVLRSVIRCALRCSTSSSTPT